VNRRTAPKTANKTSVLISHLALAIVEESAPFDQILRGDLTSLCEGDVVVT